jgi:hypothetical protein
MSAPAQTDWFAQNAPQANDWFALNAPSTTVAVGQNPQTPAGTQVNLVTGEGAEAAAARQAQSEIGAQGEQMHGMVSLMGRPPASIAAEKSFENALTSPLPIPRTVGQIFGGEPATNVPANMQNAAHAAEDIPALAQSLAAMPAAAEATATMGEKAANLVPNKAQAQQAFEELSTSIGEHPVKITNELAENLNELKRINTTTKTYIPPTVKGLIDRVDSFQGMGPLTYDEARDFSSEINRLSRADVAAMTDNTKRLVGGLNVALKASIQDTADFAGEGPKLAGAMNDWRKIKIAQGVWDDAKELAFRNVLKAFGWGVGAAAGYGVARKIYDAF